MERGERFLIGQPAQLRLECVPFHLKTEIAEKHNLCYVHLLQLVSETMTMETAQAELLELRNLLKKQHGVGGVSGIMLQAGNLAKKRIPPFGLVFNETNLSGYREACAESAVVELLTS